MTTRASMLRLLFRADIRLRCRAGGVVTAGERDFLAGDGPEVEVADALIVATADNPAYLELRAMIEAETTDLDRAGTVQ